MSFWNNSYWIECHSETTLIFTLEKYTRLLFSGEVLDSWNVTQSRTMVRFLSHETWRNHEVARFLSHETWRNHEPWRGSWVMKRDAITNRGEVLESWNMMQSRTVARFSIWKTPLSHQPWFGNRSEVLLSWNVTQSRTVARFCMRPLKQFYRSMVHSNKQS